MAVPVQAIYSDNAGELPAVYDTPPSLDMEFASSRVKFNGAGASEAFIVVLEALTNNGRIITQARIGQVFAPGDTGALTFAPYLNRQPSSGTSDVYHLISAGSTNAGVVKAAPGQVTGYYIVNTAAAFRYVKLYNKASSPTVGSDTPRIVLGVPPTSAANVAFDLPPFFGTGIAIATVQGVADSDSTAVSANDLAVSLYYV